MIYETKSALDDVEWGVCDFLKRIEPAGVVIFDLFRLTYACLATVF